MVAKEHHGDRSSHFPLIPSWHWAHESLITLLEVRVHTPALGWKLGEGEMRDLQMIHTELLSGTSGVRGSHSLKAQTKITGSA